MAEHFRTSAAARRAVLINTADEVDEFFTNKAEEAAEAAQEKASWAEDEKGLSLHDIVADNDDEEGFEVIDWGPTFYKDSEEALFQEYEWKNATSLAALEAEEKVELEQIDDDIIVNLTKPGDGRRADRRHKMAKVKAKKVRKTQKTTRASKAEVLNLDEEETGVATRNVLWFASLDPWDNRGLPELPRVQQQKRIKNALKLLGGKVLTITKQVEGNSRRTKALRQGWQEVPDVEVHNPEALSALEWEQAAYLEKCSGRDFWPSPESERTEYIRFCERAGWASWGPEEAQLDLGEPKTLGKMLLAILATKRAA